MYCFAFPAFSSRSTTTPFSTFVSLILLDRVCLVVPIFTTIPQHTTLGHRHKIRRKKGLFNRGKVVKINSMSILYNTILLGKDLFKEYLKIH